MTKACRTPVAILALLLGVVVLLLVPSVALAAPPAPTGVTSDTHPNQALWYANPTPHFTWNASPGATGYLYTIDRYSYTQWMPGDIHTTTGTTFTATDLQDAAGYADGVWFFHVCAYTGDYNSAANRSANVDFAVHINSLSAITDLISSSHWNPTEWYSDNTPTFSWGVSASRLVQVGAGDVPGHARDVAVGGDYAYVPAGNGGLDILNISDPFNPQNVSILPPDAVGYPSYVEPECVDIFGNSLALAGSGTLVVYDDLSLPTIPAGKHTARSGTARDYNDVSLSDSADFACGVGNVTGSPGTGCFDVMTFSSGGGTAGYYHTFAGQGNGVDVSGNYAYVAAGTAGLKIWDMTNPASPTLLSTTTYAGANATDVEVAGSLAYLTDANNGLVVINVDPLNACFVVGSLPLTGAKELSLYEQRAYVALGGNGLAIVNVTVPYLPQLEVTGPPEHGTDPVALAGEYWKAVPLGDYVYVAAEWGTFQTLSVYGADAVSYSMDTDPSGSAGTTNYGVLPGVTLAAQPDGSRYFHVAAHTPLGWESALTKKVNIDTTHPSALSALTDLTPNANGWFNAYPTVTLSAFDANGAALYWSPMHDPYDAPPAVGDPLGWVGYSGPLFIDSWPGTSKLYFKAVDPAGNTSTGYKLLKIDTLAPSAPATVSGSPGTWVNTNVTLTASGATDQYWSGGIDYYEFSTDGGTIWNPMPDAGHTSVTFSTDGQRTVLVRAVDVAGNAGSAALPVWVQIDKTLPTSTWAGPADDGTWCKGAFPPYDNVRFFVEAHDAMPSGTVTPWCAIDPIDRDNPLPSEWVVATVGAHGVRVEGDGVHTVLYRAIDAAGNVEEPFHVAHVRVDSSAPYGTLTINGGAEFTNDPDVTVVSDVQDDFSGVSTMSFSADGGVNWTDSAPYSDNEVTLTLAGPDGVNTVDAEYSDAVGNLFYASDDIVLDTGLPGQPSVSGGDAAWHSTDRILTAQGSIDSISGVNHYECSIDGGESTDVDGSNADGGSVTFSENCDHRVRFRAVDNAGNAGPWSDPATVRIDKTVPETAITKPAAGDYYIVGATVLSSGSFSDAGGSGVALTRVFNGNAWTTVTSSPFNTQIYTGAVGTYTFKVECTDGAGNTTTTSVSYSVVLQADTTAPKITPTNIAIGGKQTYPLHDPLAIDFTATDGGSGTATDRMNVHVVKPGGGTLDLPVYPTAGLGGPNDVGATTHDVAALTDEEGEYQVTITATDRAGNIGTAQLTYYILGEKGDLTLTQTGLNNEPNYEPEPNSLQKPVYVAPTNEIVHMTFTMSPRAKTSPADVDKMKNLTPRLYIIDPATGQIVYKAPALFTYNLSMQYWEYYWDASTIYSYIPAGGIWLRQVIVLCDPALAPVAVVVGGGEGPGGGGSPGKKPRSTTTSSLAAVSTDAQVAKVASTTTMTATGTSISPMGGRVAAPTISSFTTSAPIDATLKTAQITIAGANLGAGTATSSTTFVDMFGYLGGATTASHWFTNGTNPQLAITSWASSKIVIRSPKPYLDQASGKYLGIYGDFSMLVKTSGVPTSTVALTVSYSGDTTDWRYLRRS